MDATLTPPVVPAILDQQTVQRPAATSDAGQASKSAEEFEALFLSQMLSHMFSGIETDKVFGGGPSESVYRSLMIDEYGKVLARTGGVGLADPVRREILKMQDIAEGGHGKPGK